MKFSEKRKKWAAWACSKKLIQWYLALTYEDRLKLLKKDKTEWEYITGLYDSDGCLRQGRYAQICGWNFDKNIFVGELLKSLGVDHTVHKDRVWVKSNSSKKFFNNVYSIIAHRNPEWKKKT